MKRRHPDASMLLVEKESSLARHQTGRNSGVIHAGVYYQPGSLRAAFCKRGIPETLDFCKRIAPGRAKKRFSMNGGPVYHDRLSFVAANERQDDTMRKSSWSYP
jgi:L-2-hydroxyglutarate oxidase LhgO